MTTNNNIKFKLNPKILQLYKSGKRFNAVFGGRDSGKSYGLAQLIIIYAMTEANIIIMAAKGTMRSIKDSIKSLLEALISIYNLDDYFYKTDREIICKLTKSKIIFAGLSKAERVRSIYGIKYLFLEEASIDVDETDLTRDLFPTIRMPGNRIFLCWNPRYKEDAVHKLFIENKMANSCVIKLDYTDNKKYISPETLTYIEELKEKNLSEYNHIYMVELIQDVKGALWQRDDIIKLNDDDRSILVDNNWNLLEKIIVSIDPSISANKNSDACGIVVVGKYKKEKKYIVLEEDSKVRTPNEWVTAGINLYDKYNANMIVYENNQGGLLVKELISKMRQDILVGSIHASKSKLVRAEPVAALYKNGLVKHFRTLAQLEYEMTTYTGVEKSPNSLDAMVHGITYLHDEDDDNYVPADMSQLSF